MSLFACTWQSVLQVGWTSQIFFSNSFHFFRNLKPKSFIFPSCFSYSQNPNGSQILREVFLSSASTFPHKFNVMCIHYIHQWSSSIPDPKVLYFGVNWQYSIWQFISVCYMTYLAHSWCLHNRQDTGMSIYINKVTNYTVTFTGTVLFFVNTW